MSLPNHHYRLLTALANRGRNRQPPIIGCSSANHIEHKYTLDGTNIVKETWDGNTLVPLYDNTESVCGITYNGTSYYFLKNLQGDVIAITDSTGTVVARYSYDAWGVCTIESDTTDCKIAEINPYRYRSYYLDQEIGMYYLQSRHYDQQVGRFISIDVYLGANDDHTSYDLYTYCGNCPINRYDRGGRTWDNVWNSIKNRIRKGLNKTNKVLICLGVDTAACGAYFLDMNKDRYGIYHAKFDCWQYKYGYNDFYDFMFDIGTSMKSAKFPFEYSKKSYILWAWKGNYINLGAGAELGIYYGGEPHWLVDKKLAMNMSMELKYKGDRIISHSAKTWWITGFNPKPKYLDAKASDLKATFKVIFNNKGMYEAFRNKFNRKWTCNNKKKSASYTF